MDDEIKILDALLEVTATCREIMEKDESYSAERRANMSRLVHDLRSMRARVRLHGRFKSRAWSHVQHV